MKNKTIGPIILVIFLSGCVSVPRETVALSEQLGTMIRSAKESHLALVDQYIADRKAQVDQFLNDKWFPDFMKDFTQSSGIEDKLSKESDPEAKLKLLRQFSEAAAGQLQKRRSTMMDSLDKVRDSLRQKLDDHYDNMRITNEALTAHLGAIAKATETRDEILKRLHLPTQKILPMDKLNATMDKLVEYRGKVDEIQGMVDGAKLIIKEESTDGR